MKGTYTISNKALAAWTLGVGGTLFALGAWIGMNNTKRNQSELQQTVNSQQQQIQSLNDTIIKLKLTQKDTILSLQDH